MTRLTTFNPLALLANKRFELTRESGFATEAFKQAERLKVPYSQYDWGVDDQRDAFKHGFVNAKLVAQLSPRYGNVSALGVVKALGDTDEAASLLERFGRFKELAASQRLDFFNSGQGLLDGLRLAKQGITDNDKIAEAIYERLQQGHYATSSDDKRQFSARQWLGQALRIIAFGEG
jgi:hypothetical protein